MLRFHICNNDCNCGLNQTKQTLREVGDYVKFAIGQFTQSQSETITVRFC